jgi:hypothetical protein
MSINEIIQYHEEKAKQCYTPNKGRIHTMSLAKRSNAHYHDTIVAFLKKIENSVPSVVK